MKMAIVHHLICVIFLSRWLMQTIVAILISAISIVLIVDIVLFLIRRFKADDL